MNKIIYFIKKEIVLVVAFVLALISSFVIHPDTTYISYIDYRTLSILFSLMLTMAGFKYLGIFKQLGESLVYKMNTTLGVAFVLIVLCFISSMFITNDVALLTFVPFSIITLSIAKREDLFIPVIVLETIAANLGSMATPIGNPQNLYLYSLAGLTLPAFLKLMLPYSLFSAFLLLVFLFLKVSKSPVEISQKSDFKRNSKEKFLLFIYAICFFISILVVARVLDYRIGLVLVLGLSLIFDHKRIVEPDYSLIFTFVFLFIFIGNIKRIPILNESLQSLVSSNEVYVSILLSQFISNVPAAILCSGFTSDISALIIGTNFGGLGTLIASMASLISFKQYSAINGSNKGKYIKDFTIISLIFLAALLIIYKILNI